MRVKTIAEICANPHGPRSWRMRDAAGDGTKAVTVFPRRFGSLLQLPDGQLCRLKHHVLAVIQLPVSSEDAPFTFQAFVESGVGKWRHDSEARQVNARLHGELGGFQEHVGAVMIKAKHEAALKGDAVFMKPLYNLDEFVGRIKTL